MCTLLTGRKRKMNVERKTKENVQQQQNITTTGCLASRPTPQTQSRGLAGWQLAGLLSTLVSLQMPAWLLLGFSSCCTWHLSASATNCHTFQLMPNLRCQSESDHLNSWCWCWCACLQNQDLLFRVDHVASCSLLLGHQGPRTGEIIKQTLLYILPNVLFDPEPDEMNACQPCISKTQQKSWSWPLMIVCAGDPAAAGAHRDGIRRQAALVWARLVQ